MKFRNLIALIVILTCLPLSLLAQGSASKNSPARDPKTGRFIKKTSVSAKTGAKKKLPARDPKTGRFIKSGATAKKGPARDPKTGRFIKKS